MITEEDCNAGGEHDEFLVKRCIAIAGVGTDGYRLVERS